MIYLASQADGATADPAVFPGTEWAVATPESQGLDSARLNAAVNWLAARAGDDGVRQLGIVRHGRLVWQGDRIDAVHGVWSLTKSFTSTALGLLIDDGKCSLETRAATVLPALAAAYPDVTLRHFTTMTSGYRAVGDEPKGTYLHGPSATPFDPSPEPLFAPGTHYAYWDSAMNLFGLVLTKLAGEPLEQLVRRRIAEPVGMDPKRWKWGDFGAVDGLRVNGGSGNSGKHLQISCRELLRFGLLYLNRGEWAGERLISESWVATATAVQVPLATPLGGPAAIDGRGVYGCNWWVNGTGADGQRKWPGAPADAFAASGFNNNDLFILPGWDMVVCRLGLDEGQQKIEDEVYGEFLRQLGEAVLR
jgi:CubicO group peptidase (beta-lactamase class C family)